MRTICLRGGRVIDPASGFDAVADVRIEGAKIAAVGGHVGEADETLDLRGKVVAPGLIDLHVHLREPGQEGKETIAVPIVGNTTGRPAR